MLISIAGYFEVAGMMARLRFEISRGKPSPNHEIVRMV